MCQKTGLTHLHTQGGNTPNEYNGDQNTQQEKQRPLPLPPKGMEKTGRNSLLPPLPALDIDPDCHM